MVIEKYKQYVLSGPLKNDLNELKGKKLMCWCCPEKCHGDVLIELVKQWSGETVEQRNSK